MGMNAYLQKQVSDARNAESISACLASAFIMWVNTWVKCHVTTDRSTSQKWRTWHSLSSVDNRVCWTFNHGSGT